MKFITRTLSVFISLSGVIYGICSQIERLYLEIQWIDLEKYMDKYLAILTYRTNLKKIFIVLLFIRFFLLPYILGLIEECKARKQEIAIEQVDKFAGYKEQEKIIQFGIIWCLISFLMYLFTAWPISTIFELEFITMISFLSFILPPRFFQKKNRKPVQGNSEPEETEDNI